MSDILGTDEDVIYRDMENEAEKKLLKTAISKLSKREQTIVSLRFGINSRDGEEKTQKEVADLLGISQSYISRLEKKIMRRLRKEIIRFEHGSATKKRPLTWKVKGFYFLYFPRNRIFARGNEHDSTDIDYQEEWNHGS